MKYVVLVKGSSRRQKTDKPFGAPLAIQAITTSLESCEGLPAIVSLGVKTTLYQVIQTSLENGIVVRQIKIAQKTKLRHYRKTESKSVNKQGC